ncbi:MAG TPA: alginate lyase family protein, partial [Polyangiaceae bacterium]|nr:alginate lyase family protein [Polyangiaceae bacterium]
MQVARTVRRSIALSWLSLMPLACAPSPEASCGDARPAELRLPLVTLDQNLLEGARSCPRAYTSELATLTGMANKLVGAPVVSVVQKTKLPASGDIHDYYSIGRYYWPDPHSPDGLPYINRDGDVNPEVDSSAYDKHASDVFFGNVQTLSLAYFYTRQERYADAAMAQIRAWLIDPNTRMNPEVSYGSAIPGESDGRSFGIVELVRFHEILDAAALLSDSSAQTEADREALRAWMASYGDWLKTSVFGATEHAAQNNHGSWYDVQRVAIGQLLEARDDVLSQLEAVKQARIDVQITADGELPLEAARADGWYYSCYGLLALIELADVGARLGVDLWNY